MSTKYVSTLTGPEMDAALIDMAYHNSEAYAVGTRNGVAVGSSDVTYHNNSKYWAEQVYGYTDRAEDAANRAEAAVPAGTAGAVFFDRAQTLTTAQQEQVKANISAGSTNPNLLDNPFFTVNQRGFTTSTETNGLFCVDRWFINNGSGTITKTANGILIDNTQGTRYNTTQQIFGQGDMLAGKTVTISINDGGTIYSRQIDIPQRTSSVQTLLHWAYKTGVELRLYVLTTSDAGAYNFQLYAGIGYSIDLRAVKLEVGTVSTLANDAPPDYGAELLKCMRYFQRIQASAGTAYIGTGVCFTSQAYCVVNLPVPLRTTSVTTAINGALSVQIPGSVLTASGQTFYVRTPSTIMIAATISGATAGQACLLALKDSGNYIDLSADL